MPHVPAQRRHARGRPDRGGRAHRRRRPAARHAAQRAAAPPARLTPRAAPAPPRRGRARRPRPATRSSAGASPSPASLDRLRLPADDPRRARRALANPMSEDQSILRTTLLGSLLDAARHNVARGGADLRLFESGAVYLRAADAAERAAATSTTRSARCCTGALRRASWRDAEPPRADFFAAKGAARRACSTRCASTGGASRRSEPFLHPGRSARVLAGGERGRLARRGAPARRARLGPRRRASPPSRSTSAGRRGRAARSPRYADLTTLPGACARTSRSWSADDVAGRARARRRRAARAASCCARRGLRRLPRRAGRRGPRLARAAPRVPRARPHAHRRGRRAACASRSSPRCARARGRAAWLSVARPGRRRVGLRRRARGAAGRPPPALRARRP